MSSPIGELSVTPHRISLCILLQVYLRCRDRSLALLLVREIKGVETVREKKLPELVACLEACDLLNGRIWASELLSTLHEMDDIDKMVTFVLGDMKKGHPARTRPGRRL